jgi:uncharacterized protein YrrD
MKQVELKEGTSVYTPDGRELGKINRFVLDPETDEITHIVIQKGWLFTEDKVIPFASVRSTNEDKVVLDENIPNFDQLPPFKETHYIGLGERDRAARTVPADAYPADVFVPGFYWYPPYGYAANPAAQLPYSTWPRTETEQNIPANTVPLEEGAKVISSDGKHAGNIERLLVDPGTNKVSHFVVAEGILFKDRKLIPANWIKSVSEEEVHLNVSADILNRVPSYQS